MPIYDYLCTACDHRADILHGINDPGPHFCPSCGAEGAMRKQFTTPAIHFKGSGWAKKDRGSSSATRAASGSSEGKDAKGGDASPSGKDAGSGGESGSSTSSDSTGSTSSDSTGSKSTDSTGSTSSGRTGSKGDKSPSSSSDKGD